MNRRSQMLSSVGTQVTSVCTLREECFKVASSTEFVARETFGYL